MIENGPKSIPDPKEEIRQLVRAAINAKENGNESEQTRLWMEISKLHLKNELDIDNLTTIEGVHLHQITEQVVKEQIEQTTKRDRLQKEGDTGGAWLANLAAYGDLDDEIVDRLLLELYGIREEDIPKAYTVYDDSGNKVLETMNKQAAKEKAAQTAVRGDPCFFIDRKKITEDFKEYLRRLRDKSHIP